MNRMLLFTIGATLVVSALSMAIEESEKKTPLWQFTNFSMYALDDMYDKLTKTHTGNMVYCPLSISMIMSMAALGCRGNTATQIRDAMKMPDDETTKTAMKALVPEMNMKRDATIKMANKMYMAKDMNIKQNFMDMMEKDFMSKPEKIDFTNTAECTKTINDWAEQMTDNHIKNLVKPEDIEGAKMMLLNAIYFKASWPERFESMTDMTGFHTTSDTSKMIPMMKKTSNFLFGNIPEAEAMYIMMPFKSSDAAESIIMMIVMPDEIDGLNSMEKKLDDVDWDKIHREAQLRQATLTMPKFKIETMMDLVPMLKEMGMTDMFSDTADLSGMTDDSEMKFSKAMQKACLEINEEGAEAAVATGLEAEGRSSPMEITVDRPFVFAIMIDNDKMSTILFQGRVTDPEA